MNAAASIHNAVVIYHSPVSMTLKIVIDSFDRVELAFLKNICALSYSNAWYFIISWTTLTIRDIIFLIQNYSVRAPRNKMIDESDKSLMNSLIKRRNPARIIHYEHLELFSMRLVVD